MPFNTTLPLTRSCKDGRRWASPQMRASRGLIPVARVCRLGLPCVRLLPRRGVHALLLPRAACRSLRFRQAHQHFLVCGREPQLQGPSAACIASSPARALAQHRLRRFIVLLLVAQVYVQLHAGTLLPDRYPRQRTLVPLTGAYPSWVSPASTVALPLAITPTWVGSRPSRGPRTLRL